MYKSSQHLVAENTSFIPVYSSLEVLYISNLMAAVGISTVIDHPDNRSNQDAGTLHPSTEYDPSISSCSTSAETVIEPEGETAVGNGKKKWETNDAYDTDPDGGYGWAVVVGAFFGYFTSFGTETAWGVFQAYFEKDVFHDVPDAQFQLSFAGTLIGIMVNIAGPFFQILSARFDIRLIIALGVIIMVLGLELAAFTTQIWHLYLTQGVMFGIGAAFLYVTAVSVPPQWFNRRRGLGLGIVTSGSGVGGVVLPFVISSLTNRVGIAWAYRILGFIYLGMNAITCILVKEKYPRHKKVKAADDGEDQPAVSPPKLSEIFDFSILKDKIFLWWVIASVIATMGCFTPFFFLPSYASYHGLSSEDGTAFSAVLAGSNCLGRVSAGFIGDRIGRLNTLILASIFSAIAAFGIWTVATDYNTIMAFAVVYGAFSTAYYTLVSPITATIVGIEKFPTALSVMMVSNTISIVGPNIASAIENGLDAEPYFSYKMYTGACFIVGSVLLLSLKIKMTHGVFTKI